MNDTLETDSQDAESIAAQLEYCIAPALESPQFKAPGWASDLRHAAGVIRQLERERDQARLDFTIKSERRCEFCREVPLTDKEREFISENATPTHATDE